ncbi:MAG TPA: ATP-binding protein [Gemmataceae bacterium]|nr:ATP-binding protein [Gemmataceae bacterium]
MNVTPNETRLARLLAVLRKGLGHELPNQLVAVQGLARLLDLEEGGRLSADGRGYLGRVAAGAARAHALVGALAEVARLAVPEPAEAVDLAEVVAESIAGAKQLAVGRPAEYHATVPALALPAPRPALCKVLVLLLRRAAATRAAVGTRPTAAGVEIVVAGDAPAVPPEQAGRQFEPFVGPESRGLDLFLARELAEGWGGSVRYEPGDGAGTVFVVSCPLPV